ncbi:ATP-binding cassette domain-containing protein [Paenibacillus melissococcoides]|uniref:ATP-binding cassette domain-containing protein n=1 Tax=Paenibacillus melissococcoides TaxID=2912268 RepID=A0ABN8U1R5_9BACL|nr:MULTISPECIES: ATP-binding cassette domain-containing protein [Paenibacillus]GIO78310.1 putative HMP/thiamine import ATP-binding protein YkoD [Paenibacillus dendritiformis]CAH8245008.1 ATP-binding cassette domain-containing protein [Paenibacillus melissococcoides]CAH8709628.1 ATP-binding cassette domain-containing protein [Paenibacillus melissococcoides]CAH8710354.1 ATP-binding cassette domain-containing protein [Paenibacillus melissococcoides]
MGFLREEVMRIERVTFTYLGADEPALRDCSFTLRRGDIVYIAGANGSGKTTLCKLLAGVMQPHEGTLQGKAAPPEGPPPVLAGLALQDADSQLILGTVEDELAFAPENMGLPADEVMRRVEEQLDAFGLESLREAPITDLSGGEKQRTAIAAVMAMEPELLILDQAWSHLDSASRERLLQTLRAGRQAGRTTVLAGARLEDWIGQLPAVRLLLLEEGRIIYDGSLHEAEAAAALDKLRTSTAVLPSSPPIAVPDETTAAVTAYRKGRLPGKHPEDAPVLEVKDLSFRYGKRRKDNAGSNGRERALDEVSFELYPGRCMLLRGPNGAGKSTLFKLLTKGIPRQAGRMSGEIRLAGQPLPRFSVYELGRLIGYVPQQPEAGLFAGTVEEEVLDAAAMAWRSTRLNAPVPPGQAKREDAVAAMAEELLRATGLSRYRRRHPHDLPAGAIRLLCVALAGLHRPAVLLLDEPTAGLDARSAALIRDWCLAQTGRGCGLMVITHDDIWDEGAHSQLVTAYMEAGCWYGADGRRSAGPEQH